jgi:hypothetical protein
VIKRPVFAQDVEVIGDFEAVVGLIPGPHLGQAGRFPRNGQAVAR